MPTLEMSTPTRRTFCAYACRAATGLAAGAMGGCGGGTGSPAAPSSAPIPPAQDSTVSATVAGRVVSIALDRAPALASVGAGAMVRTSLGLFLVARTGQDTFSALSGICTHEECEVTGFSNGRFVCPCHGSQFTTSGALALGPATRGLERFPTQVSGGVLTFTV